MLRSVKVALFATVLAAHSRAEDDLEMPEEDAGTEQEPLTHEQMHLVHGKADANKDGKISMEEILAYSASMRKAIAIKDAKSLLEDIDTDKDGKITLDELMKDMENLGDGEGDEEDKKEGQSRRHYESEKFKIADANGDGFVDEKELPALFYPETHEGVLELTAKAAVSQKDVDKDGFLSISEFWGGDRVQGQDQSLSDGEKADFKSLDTDGDGKLSLQELKVWESGHFHISEAMKKMFDLADKDRDMHVTADELSSARKQIAGIDAHHDLLEWAEHHGEL